MRALPVRDEASSASTRAFLLEAWLCCNATTGRPSRPSLAAAVHGQGSSKANDRFSFRPGQLAFRVSCLRCRRSSLFSHALRPHRSPPLPPDRRGGLDHPRRRAGASRARRRLDPRPAHGGVARRAAPDPRPPGRDADRGRTHASPARAHDPGRDRAAARRARRLFGRARRPGQGAVEHQRAARIPARGAERVPRRASAGQRRPRGAALRRDRRADRRGRRRCRHRRRHGRYRRARDLPVPLRPLRRRRRARQPARGAARP